MISKVVGDLYKSSHNLCKHTSVLVRSIQSTNHVHLVLEPPHQYLGAGFRFSFTIHFTSGPCRLWKLCNDSRWAQVTLFFYVPDSLLDLPDGISDVPAVPDGTLMFLMSLWSSVVFLMLPMVFSDVFMVSLLCLMVFLVTMHSLPNWGLFCMAGDGSGRRWFRGIATAWDANRRQQRRSPRSIASQAEIRWLWGRRDEKPSRAGTKKNWIPEMMQNPPDQHI